MKASYLVLGTILALGVTAGAIAQNDDGHRGGRHGGGSQRMQQFGFGNPERLVNMMTARLELDESQSATISNILAAAKPEMEALRDRARAGRTSMESLDVNDPDYGSKLQNASTEIGALASEAALLYGRLRADVYAVLTPAQQAEADQAKGELKERFRRHRQHGPAE